MNVSIRPLLAVALLPLLTSRPLTAQVLHVNDRWDECAIVIDPSLTQEAWRQFVGEAALVAYFRPLATARPMGAGNIEVAVLDWATRIDAAEDAWNDTFSHPDSTHWLFEGDALRIPGLMLRIGVAEGVDVGAYFTKSVGANYGFLGGQVQYSVMDDAERDFGAAGRLTMVHLFGPEDLGLSVYGLDFLVSKGLSVFSPYAGLSGHLSRGREHTDKVSLDDESVFGVQGMVGVSARLGALRLAAELNVAKVSGYSFKIAHGS